MKQSRTQSDSIVRQVPLINISELKIPRERRKTDGPQRSTGAYDRGDAVFASIN